MLETQNEGKCVITFVIKLSATTTPRPQPDANTWVEELDLMQSL